MLIALRAAALTGLLVLAACGQSRTPVDAGAVPSDGGGAVDAGSNEADAGSPADAGPDTRFRLVAANLTSGNLQSYDPGEGIRILQGLHPDVAMIQEFNYGTGSAQDIRSFVDTTFGPQFSYVRGTAGQQIPNGVVSRFPIVASGDWTDPQVSNRDFVWAHLDLPGSQDLWVVSVHLLTTSATSRAAEAAALVQEIQQNVPAGDYLAIGGDFNTTTRTEGCFTSFSQVVVTTGPYPADQAGNGNTNASRARPYDWVVVDSDLAAHAVPVDLGANAFPGGLVFDSRVYAPLSEVPPAQIGDSGATNMQHMAVVRDFDVPN